MTGIYIYAEDLYLSIFVPYSVFDGGFIEVLRDVHALACIRDSSIFMHEDTVSMMHIDNQQAWIQSRLSGFTNSSFKGC